jgi:Tfp pilus assembly protein PilF
MSRLWTGPLLVTGLALTLVLPGCGSESQWTTDSPQALEEFELGLEASMKLYHADAAEHFRKAIELDPGFVAAKLRLLEYQQGEEERNEIISDLRQVDLERHTPLERFLVEYILARIDHESGTAEELLDDFLVDHPEDPFALAICSFEAWKSMDWPKAERHYRNLLDIDPNWVIAQNRLGYMAMAQGKFEEAEELFKTYKYIAPDQANPHDSLGELLTLLGRYDEAREELEQALAIKSDFCPSYQHLFDLAVLEGRTQNFEEIGRRAVENCEGEILPLCLFSLDLLSREKLRRALGDSGRGVSGAVGRVRLSRLSVSQPEWAIERSGGVGRETATTDQGDGRELSGRCPGTPCGSPSCPGFAIGRGRRLLPGCGAISKGR